MLVYVLAKLYLLPYNMGKPLKRLTLFTATDIFFKKYTTEQF